MPNNLSPCFISLLGSYMGVTILGFKTVQTVKGTHIYHILLLFRDGPFDSQEGAGIFWKKIVCFPAGAKKMSSQKLKIKSLFFIQ